MRTAVRAIIIHDNNFLVMQRDKFGTRYYTLIGGHVEMGESKNKALLREIHEETRLHVANPRLVFIEHAPAPYGDQFVYICDYVSGVPMLHEHSDERAINKGGDNIYTPMWIPLSELPNLPFRTKDIQQRILAGVRHGFPTKVEEFDSEIDY